MKTANKISCIIPTCDRNALLIEAIDSVLKQTVRPFEIIIVNNGKSRVEIPFLDELITIYDIEPYVGVSRARNFGAAMAQGDFVAFLDDDDMWSEKYLENVSEAIEKGAKCTISRLDILKNGKISPHKNIAKKYNLATLMVSNPGITGSNVVIEKKLFFEMGGYDSLVSSEDKSLLIEILNRGREAQPLPDNYVIFREHGGPRLTNPAKMADGTYRFMKKYSHLMNRKQKVYNWLKIYRYRYESGQKLAFLGFLFFKVVNFFVNKLWDN